MAEWKHLLRETHRRSLWQVLGVYALASWGVLQVVLALYEAVGLPQWVPPVTVAILAVGLPVVLATAFVQKRLPRAAEHASRTDYDPTLHPNLEDVRDGMSSGDRVTRLLTWRRSIIGGVAAFTLLASGTTGFVALQRRGTLVAQGLVDSASPVVLADFANSSRDSTLGSVVTEALRVDLAQSNVVRLAQATEIADALQRMQRTPSQGLPSTVARELAEREGLRAVITGQVSSIGAGYVITSTVISADSGRTLASFRSEAKDSTQLIAAMNNLSKQVRQKIGESVRSVRNAMPLYQATTSSLSALRKYTEAEVISRETGDRLRTIAILQEAVAIDSTFADAWGDIGINLDNLGVRPAERDVALTHAYQLRDRLPDYDRYHMIALYMSIVRQNGDSAIDAYRQILANDSLDYGALNNLSIILLHRTRYTEAEVMLRRATQVDRSSPNAWFNLMNVLFYQGKSEDAARAFDSARAVLPNNHRLREFELNIAGNAGRWDRIDSIASAIAAAYPADNNIQLDAMRWRLSAAQGLGHFERARAIGLQLRDRLNEMHFPGYAILTVCAISDTRFAAGDSIGAARELDAWLRDHPLTVFPPGTGPDDDVATAFIHYGRTDRARAIIDARRNRMSGPDEMDRYLRALLDVNRGRTTAAASAATIHVRLDSILCVSCRLVELGRAYQAAGQMDSARAVYERYLAAPFTNRLSVQSLSRPDVLIRLAALYEQANDKQRAIARYAEFVQLWSTADPALQPRVDVARKRLLTLQGKG